MPGHRLAEQAQLEHVDQLVTQRMAEVGVAAGERQGHAAFQEFGGAEQPLGRHEREDVGLLEVSVRGIDDQRHSAADRVREPPLQHVVALLSVGERDPSQLFFFGIVVEVHVLAAEHAPVEAPILDLVLAEVPELRRGRRGEPRQQDDRGGEQVEAHQRWMLRMRSPIAIRGSVRMSPVTRPKTV